MSLINFLECELPIRDELYKVVYDQTIPTLIWKVYIHVDLASEWVLIPWDVLNKSSFALETIKKKLAVHIEEQKQAMANERYEYDPNDVA